MGNLNEKDLASDRTRLRMKSQGLAYDFSPGSKDGVGFQWDIDLQRLQSLLQD